MKDPAEFEIGEYRCWILPDGQMSYPGAALGVPELAKAEATTLTYSPLLVNTGSICILIDAGAGTLGSETGRLPRSLAAAGFAPDDIHAVILSHAHRDHYGDLRLFANAAVIMMRKEFEFWSSPETRAKLAAGALYGIPEMEHSMEVSGRDLVASIESRMRLLDRPTEIAAGVLVFAAPGHTPGHAAVLVSSGRQQLLVLGDAIAHPAHCEHPEWTSRFDLAPDVTARTRRQLLERAAADRCFVAGYHMPGAVGVVSARRTTYEWESVISVDASV